MHFEHQPGDVLQVDFAGDKMSYVDICRRALQGTRVNFGVIKNILDKNLDSIDQQDDVQFSLPFHENLRGNQAYQ